MSELQRKLANMRYQQAGKLKGSNDAPTSHAMRASRSSSRLQQSSNSSFNAKEATSVVDPAQWDDGLVTFSEGGSTSASSNGGITRVGGEDLDSDRPAKFAKLFAQNESEQDSETFDHDQDDESVADGTPVPVQEDSIRDQSTVLGSPAPINTGSASPATNQKKPKGWHLRKENRHLLGKAKIARIEKHSTPDAQDKSGLPKKLPGRRRATHPDSSIEADLRRQGDLKLYFREVGKALKPILTELAERSVQQLEADKNFHTRFPEYDQVICELDRRLKHSIDEIEQEYREEEARLKRMKEAEIHIRNAQVQVCSPQSITDS